MDPETPLGQGGPNQFDKFDLRSYAFRFLGAVTFGVFIDIVILCLYTAAVTIGYEPGILGLYYTLIEVPVICGILGVFFMSEMIDLAGEIRERVLPLLR